jgi:hypothetical protein
MSSKNRQSSSVKPINLTHNVMRQSKKVPLRLLANCREPI